MSTNDTQAALPTDDPYSQENIARRKALQIAERAPNGQLYPGSVLPGAGRKPDGVSVTMLARQYTEPAIKVLGDIANNPKAPPASRVAAAAALLDRGWGKAPVQIDITHKTRFDDFLRDVGIAAVYEHDHPAALPDALIEAIGDEIEAEDGSGSEIDP